jgi:hypothetical protein
MIMQVVLGTIDYQKLIFVCMSEYVVHIMEGRREGGVSKCACMVM